MASPGRGCAGEAARLGVEREGSPGTRPHMRHSVSESLELELSSCTACVGAPAGLSATFRFDKAPARAATSEGPFVDVCLWISPAGLLFGWLALSAAFGVGFSPDIVELVAQPITCSYSSMILVSNCWPGNLHAAPSCLRLPSTLEHWWFSRLVQIRQTTWRPVPNPLSPAVTASMHVVQK